MKVDIRKDTTKVRLFLNIAKMWREEKKILAFLRIIQIIIITLYHLLFFTNEN